VSRATAKSRGLTAKQARELLAERPEPDQEVSDLTISRAYRFADGRELLVLGDGKGRLYESRADLLAMFGQVAARKPVSPFAALLPQGRSFAADAPRLAAELSLPVLTGVPRLDDIVRRLGVPACRKPPVFGRLVAYVGETIIAARGGSWQMRLGADGTTWEPWVVDAEGGSHAPFGLVHKELSEWSPQASLTGVVAGHLGHLGPALQLVDRGCGGVDAS
jgi:hypothetical protein